MKNKPNTHNPGKINPVLYAYYRCLKDKLGAEIVHRRRRKSSTCIEIVFHCELFKCLSCHLNTLPEAERCGYWLMCRPQTSRKHKTWHGHLVCQLFLSPVHPKKQREQQALAVSSSLTMPVNIAFIPQDLTFEPVLPKKRHQYLHACKIFCTFAASKVKRNDHYGSV